MRRFDDYVPALEAAKVVLDADRRKEIILPDAQNLAFAHGLDLVEDEGLLEEVAGLVEWPVVLMGAFEESFLAIPPEVIRPPSAPTRSASCCATALPAAGRRSAKPSASLQSPRTSRRTGPPPGGNATRSPQGEGGAARASPTSSSSSPT